MFRRSPRRSCYGALPGTYSQPIQAAAVDPVSQYTNEPVYETPNVSPKQRYIQQYQQLSDEFCTKNKSSPLGQLRYCRSPKIRQGQIAYINDTAPGPDLDEIGEDDLVRMFEHLNYTYNVPAMTQRNAQYIKQLQQIASDLLYYLSQIPMDQVTRRQVPQFIELVKLSNMSIRNQLEPQEIAELYRLIYEDLQQSPELTELVNWPMGPILAKNSEWTQRNVAALFQNITNPIALNEIIQRLSNTLNTLPKSDIPPAVFEIMQRLLGMWRDLFYTAAKTSKGSTAYTQYKFGKDSYNFKDPHHCGSLLRKNTKCAPKERAERIVNNFQTLSNASEKYPQAFLAIDNDLANEHIDDSLFF